MTLRATTRAVIAQEWGAYYSALARLTQGDSFYDGNYHQRTSAWWYAKARKLMGIE